MHGANVKITEELFDMRIVVFSETQPAFFYSCLETRHFESITVFDTRFNYF